MKYFSTVSAVGLGLLAQTAHAGLEQITSSIMDAYAKDQDADINSNSMTGVVDGVQDKTFAFFIESFLATIDGYGCWCNFNEDYVKGKGPVVNTPDGYCKTLVYGYECAIKDGQDSGNACDTPWNVPYIPHNIAITPVTSVSDQCIANNPGDDCATYSCIIEGHMTELLFADFLNGVVYDPTYKHSNNFFDPDTECHIVGTGSGQSEKECCGDYPFRFPYKTYNDERACCGQKTYNVFNKCCEDEDSSLLLSAGSCT